MIIIGNAQFQATVSQGLNRDSLKLLRYSQFSGFQPSLPTPKLNLAMLEIRS